MNPVLIFVVQFNMYGNCVTGLSRYRVGERQSECVQAIGYLYKSYAIRVTVYEQMT